MAIKTALREAAGKIKGKAAARQVHFQRLYSASGWATYTWKACRTTAKALGGDRRSGRIEAHAPLILGLVERAADATLKEIRAELAKAGVPAGIGTLWRFFERRRMTWKKRRRAPPSRTARTS